MTPDAVEIAERYASVVERIGVAGGNDVTVIAVTKKHPVAVVAAAVEAGLIDIGENYAQELATKRGEIGGARWHFIGQLQTNKARLLFPPPDPAEPDALGPLTIHSVDRNSLVDVIARLHPGAQVLIQVDLSGEPGRGGAAPEQVDALVERAVSHGLDVLGLMAVAPFGSTTQDAAIGFSLVRDLRDKLGLRELSMGMSGDFEVAVAEGATMVRIGTAIFGSRQR